VGPHVHADEDTENDVPVEMETVMKRSFLLTSCALLSALAGGCGSLASDTDQHEPLAVLQGELTNPDAMEASSSVRVAVIWNCGDLDGEMYRASQEVEVQPVFPSRFRLELTEPPPAGCMVNPFDEGEDDPPPQVGGDTPDATADESGSSGSTGSSGTEDPDEPPPAPNTPQDLASSSSGNFRVALGTIAAYEDLNGNGKLDLVGPDAQDYVDAVVGTNENLMLVYLEGSVPQGWDELRDSEGNLPSLGYNLFELSEPIAVGPQVGDALVACGYAYGGGSGDGTEDGTDPEGDSAEPVPMPEGPTEEEYEKPTMRWLDASTFFVLTMSADPRFASMMCRDSDGFASSGSVGMSTTDPTGEVPVPDQYPAADDPGLTCMPDGLSYYYETCVQDGVCSGKICRGSCWYMPDELNPPADWPCPIE